MSLKIESGHRPHGTCVPPELSRKNFQLERVRRRSVGFDLRIFDKPKSSGNSGTIVILCIFSLC